MTATLARPAPTPSPPSEVAPAPVFRGFRSPSYTMVPDELFDELLPDLSGAELKVLLFVVRRTFGFKRERDRISLAQMLHGITTREGRVLHRGVGLSKPTLLGALRSLQAKGAAPRRRGTSRPATRCASLSGPLRLPQRPSKPLRIRCPKPRPPPW